jgi:hypothetical protein
LHDLLAGEEARTVTRGVNGNPNDAYQQRYA